MLSPGCEMEKLHTSDANGLSLPESQKDGLFQGTVLSRVLNEA